MGKIKFLYRQTKEPKEFYVYDLHNQKFLSKAGLLNEISNNCNLGFRRAYLLVNKINDLNNKEIVRKYLIQGSKNTDGLRLTFGDKKDLDKYGVSSFRHITGCSKCGAIVHNFEEFSHCTSPGCGSKGKENWIIFDGSVHDVYVCHAQDGVLYGDYTLAV